MPTYYLGLDVHNVRTQYCLMNPAARSSPRAACRPRRGDSWSDEGPYNNGIKLTARRAAAYRADAEGQVQP